MDLSKRPGSLFFSMKFVYLYGGMEGSAHDSLVLKTAREKDFVVPRNCYFLADAGYSSRLKCVLAPYPGVRYHLKEFEKSNKRPVNASELFNLRHAGARSVIERVFAVFKRRFRIFDRAREGFSIETQILLVFGLAAIHNFIFEHEDSSELLENLEEENRENEDMNNVFHEGNDGMEDSVMIRKRDEIANEMWKEYEKILAEREAILKDFDL